MYFASDYQYHDHPGGTPVMNKLVKSSKSNQALFYLVIFLMMIGSGILLYPIAAGEYQIGMVVFLGFVVLGNLLAVFF